MDEIEVGLERTEWRSPADLRFRDVFEAVPDAVVVADRQGNIVLVNAQAEALFGYGRAELLGQPVEALIPDRYCATHPSHRRAYLAQAAPPTRPMGDRGLALFARRKDGSEFPVEISIGSVASDDGPMAVTTIRDVTARRKSEESRTKLVQAQEAIRMRDEFLSIASHELKTPLSAVLMQADALTRLLRKPGAPSVPEPLLSRLDRIHTGVRRLDALINQLLDLSRIRAGHLALQRDDVDLALTVHNVARLFQDELDRAGCELVIHADATLVGFWDPLRIEQIITNLLSNALKYGAGKPVEITITEGEHGQARIAVRDHGIGIAPEHLGRIFDRFERVASERNYGGFGLGLWIVRQVIEAHAGTIRVWSQPGAGSTFTVELPLKPSQSGLMRVAASAAAPAMDCVMIVDDDAMIRSAFVDALSDEGIAVLAAENGLDALEKLRAGARPRLIFLDLMMPVMDGATFRMEQQKDASIAQIPVAVLSAADHLETRAATLGAQACLPKPPDVGSLLRLVERYCK
jgi:two-component system sensor kinase FixL